MSDLNTNSKTTGDFSFIKFSLLLKVEELGYISPEGEANPTVPPEYIIIRSWTSEGGGLPLDFVTKFIEEKSDPQKAKELSEAYDEAVSKFRELYRQMRKAGLVQQNRLPLEAVNVAE